MDDDVAERLKDRSIYLAQRSDGIGNPRPYVSTRNPGTGKWHRVHLARLIAADIKTMTENPRTWPGWLIAPVRAKAHVMSVTCNGAEHARPASAASSRGRRPMHAQTELRPVQHGEALGTLGLEGGRGVPPWPLGPIGPRVGVPASFPKVVA